MIPDGYSIKKVTELQKQAVSSKRRHDNMEALLANENTPLVVGGAVLLAALPILSKLFFDSLELENIIISDEQKMKVEVGFRGLLFASPATGPILLTKKVWDLLTGDGEGDVGTGGLGRQP